MNTRQAAFVSLQKYENGGKYLNIEADTAIRRNALEGADRALYTNIVYGTVERRITLEYLLAQLCDRPLAKIDRNVAIILRMSLYQLRYLDRVPAYAVLQEAGELTRRFAAQSAVGFVNAVLREYERRGAEIAMPSPQADFVRYLSVTYSYPAWFCALLVRCYGKRRAEAILKAFEKNPPLTLFPNLLKTDRAGLLRALRAEGIACDETRYSPYGVRLSRHVPIDAITPLAQGLCFVQDEASQLAALALGAAPAQTILDSCACPGGKSFALALLCGDKAKIISCDLHENKLSLVRRGAEKLGIASVEAQARDSGAFYPPFENAFDRVLCDVPCSGLGVLSKKPDIREKKEEEIERLPAVQRRILENCARYVRPGGELVYSTCTVHPAENEEQIKVFLREHPEFSLQPFMLGQETVQGMQTLLPDRYAGMDGFFIAKLRKTER